MYFLVLFDRNGLWIIAKSASDSRPLRVTFMILSAIILLGIKMICDFLCRNSRIFTVFEENLDYP